MSMTEAGHEWGLPWTIHQFWPGPEDGENFGTEDAAMTTDGNQDSGLSSTDTRTERAIKNLNPLMAAVIGIFVLLMFCYAIYMTIKQLETAPVPATETQAGFSAFDRAVQVVGLVSPVLTIVLGFYFGARAGAGEGQAAAALAEGKMESARTDTDHYRSVIADLQEQGGEETRRLLAEISARWASPSRRPPHPTERTSNETQRGSREERPP